MLKKCTNTHERHVELYTKIVFFIQAAPKLDHVFIVYGGEWSIYDRKHLNLIEPLIGFRSFHRFALARVLHPIAVSTANLHHASHYVLCLHNSYT